VQLSRRCVSARASRRCSAASAAQSAARSGQRRGGGRRRRADVGDEIADREIGFVADARDDRQLRMKYGARDDLLVERPQVVERAAAAADDQHVDVRMRIRRPNRRRDFARGARTLHRRGVENDRHAGSAPAKRRQHVAQRGRMARRHDADSPRIRRQCALARAVEETRGFERALSREEPLVERALARLAHRLDVHLELAARLVDRGDRPHLDGETFAQHEPESLRLVAEEHAAHLRARVLQREVEMSGGRACDARDLAADPDEPQMTFHEEPRRRHEPRHRHDRRRVARDVGGAAADVRAAQSVIVHRWTRRTSSGTLW